MKTPQKIPIIFFLTLIQMTLSQQMGCEKNVQCVWTSNSTCVIHLNPTNSTESCKFIFNEPANNNVKRLRLWLKEAAGSDRLPELSEAASKFRNLEVLLFGFIVLKNVERARLTPFRNIKDLYLLRNNISQLDAGTFDDLTNLRVLHLQYNQIKELHWNLFNELQKLETLALNGNEIEMIPQGLFRSNEHLQRIYLQENKIRRIEFNFQSMPRLVALNLEKNACINEKFNFERIFQQFFNERVRYC